MTYRVVLSSAAIRDMDRVPPRIVPAIVEFLFGDLAAAPQRVGKALRGELDGYFSARRGPYRVIYSIDDDEVRVEVVRVDHRADVYRRK